MITSITTLGARPHRDFIYETLADMNAVLCVDVGAAAGATTRSMRESMSSEGRVVAYEPFPGNFSHFHAATAGLTNITLVQKAVCESIGTREFYVDSVVRGTEPGWQELVGYSSVGHLRTERLWKLRRLAKTLRRYFRDPASVFDSRPRTMRVETTSLDVEFPTESIDFLKLDVQGAERQVLQGARRVLDERRAGVLYIEWSGDAAVVTSLEDAGYTLFDSMYVGAWRGERAADMEQAGFRIVDRVPLSTGQLAYEMIFEGDLARVGGILRSLRRRQLGWLQTDLIAVSPDRLQRFTDSARARLNVAE